MDEEELDHRNAILLGLSAMAISIIVIISLTSTDTINIDKYISECNIEPISEEFALWQSEVCG